MCSALTRFWAMDAAEGEADAEADAEAEEDKEAESAQHRFSSSAHGAPDCNKALMPPLPLPLQFCCVRGCGNARNEGESDARRAPACQVSLLSSLLVLLLLLLVREGSRTRMQGTSKCFTDAEKSKRVRSAHVRSKSASADATSWADAVAVVNASSADKSRLDSDDKIALFRGDVDCDAAGAVAVACDEVACGGAASSAACEALWCSSSRSAMDRSTTASVEVKNDPTLREVCRREASLPNAAS